MRKIKPRPITRVVKTKNPLTFTSKSPYDPAESVRLCLLLGRILFNFGATAQRVQDSIACLARYLGCKVEVLVSYDALLITVHDGATFRTRIDSARGVAGLNLLGLKRVSALLRGLSQSPLAAEEIEKALGAIRDAPPVHGVGGQVIAAGCAGVGFCIVNDGDPASWFCSFVAGAFIFAIRRPLAAREFNFHLTVFVAALAGSFLSSLLASLAQTATPVVALVGPILFLVPGVPIINGGIDVIRNHVAIGIARVGFTVTVVVALCLAAGLTVKLIPMEVSPPFLSPGAGEIILFSLAGALAAGALAWMNNGGVPLVALCALGGCTGRLVRAWVTLGGLDPLAATLVGVLCSTLLVGFIAERLRWPPVFPAVMAALPMVPGYFAIAGLHGLLSFAAGNGADSAQLSVGLHALVRAAFLSLALIIGVIGPIILLQRERELV
jgi:uncharacterized membrane protein YjjP (DUF1212 family)